MRSTPSLGRLAKYAQAIEFAARAHRPASEPSRAKRAAVATIAGENFVAAFAAQHDFHVPGGDPSQGVRRHDRIIRARIVDGGDDARQIAPKIVPGDLDFDMIGAERLGDASRMRPLVSDRGAGKSGGIGAHRPLVETRHQRQQYARIDARTR